MRALGHAKTNRLQCLRLTERCATLLLSVRCEIAEAGSGVAEELAAPVGRLCDALNQIHSFLQKQLHRPFLKRYLRRDEILRELAACDKAVGDVVSMFGLSVQIRTLKQVQMAANESRRFAEEAQHQLDMEHQMFHLQGGSVSAPLSNNAARQGSGAGSESVPQAGNALAVDDPLRALTHLHSTQNALDTAADIAAHRGILKDVLSAGSDVELLRRMQVGRGEIPEAVKTLRRVLESMEEDRAREGQGVYGQNRRGSEQEYGRRGSMGGEDRYRHGDGMGRRDTLDREFMESGIDAMTRLSSVGIMRQEEAYGGMGDEEAAPWDLPSWTITRYEVDRTRKIGIGFFSDVYLGRWHDHVVAIKVLAPTTPRALFVREITIWRSLRHPNVLRLYGASSAVGERPWFFVSKFCSGGSLIVWLKQARDRERERMGIGERGRSVFGSASMGSPGGIVEIRRRAVSSGSLGMGMDGNGGTSGEEVDLLKCMHQIAKGMEYLHGQDVLHGDLKGANVLVDDTGRCIISDFGQSEMKSEAYRLSGQPAPRGTLRWQAPELLLGDNQLTAAVDVYAFAICCVEILGMGDLPWARLDDSTVASLVLGEKQRPPLPPSRCTSTVSHLVNMCWARNVDSRPPFTYIAASLKQFRRRQGQGLDDSPLPPSMDDLWDDSTHTHHDQRRSPDMRPMSRPFISMGSSFPDTFSSAESSPLSRSVIYTPSTHEPSELPSESSSLLTSSPHGSAADLRERNQYHRHDAEFEGYDSPPPINERQAEARNERRYRMLAKHGHGFHHSLTLPLWSPTRVSLGAVGYLSKPKGEFITLFNALNPLNTSKDALQAMPSMYGYGKFKMGSREENKRSVAQRSLDALSGFLTFKTKGDGLYSENVARRYSFPLKEGQKAAYVFAESTVYQFIDNLDAPKKWFRHNVDAILREYAPKHPIQKEDLFVVIGTLDAPDYALLVSHSHPEGQAHFNVFSNKIPGRPWGTFTTDTEAPPNSDGPSYREEIPGQAMFASKVSAVGGGDERGWGKWDTLMLARLRFKPDVEEPTSL
ncbi:hypothetical protein HYDPIDRAFT_90991 [Hydnomerulius pinastri MD-312]|uniref:Protein kinase domain-containing protein n=1 Tax=Hydnomerulius pinastri MD-312 TaxID=994086 RepID=A0A0C9W6E4_9AGAM|nr:hypothetical protein HYDPIDRAFT_102927 [Hydnomerulius pinastri MD-312]KIJ64179.1 hypothetical protein HYDPIDRAFT_90991 [Hydnomerulius pinastri MD-312]